MENIVKIASAAFADTLVVGENERRLLELFLAEKRENRTSQRAESPFAFFFKKEIQIITPKIPKLTKIVKKHYFPKKVLTYKTKKCIIHAISVFMRKKERK